MRAFRPGAGLLAGVLATAATLGAGLGLVIRLDPGRPTASRVGATLALAEALAPSGPEGFERALAPRRFAFPADHGPHSGFRTEWWYWTGNLQALGPDGGSNRFGFQLTFFRTALAPIVPLRRSAWETRDVYTAHFALTDVVAGRFHAWDRWARGVLDLAGASGKPFHVWLGDWSADAWAAGSGSMRLHAAGGDARLDLTLGSGKAPVLHGEGGLSRKSAEPGNASYYYSLTRMPAAGEVSLAGRTLPVEGLAWMDREWSTSALASEQVGWDWFALQLEDGRELMLYRLRRRDGGIAPESEGTLVGADGATTRLPRDAIDVLVLEHWVSPRGGTRYPARWQLRVPGAALELRVTPLVPDQELDLAVRYWEGAVRVEGTANGRPLGGAGYVELVGYAAASGGPAEAVRQ